MLNQQNIFTDTRTQKPYFTLDMFARQTLKQWEFFSKGECQYSMDRVWSSSMIGKMQMLFPFEQETVNCKELSHFGFWRGEFLVWEIC